MFGLFESQERKMRQNARNWIDLADSVWAYRRDLLDDAERTELRRASMQLRQGLLAGEEPAKLKLGIEELESVLRAVSGPHYPRSALAENTEFILTSFFLLFGVITYFVQPFKIPTNSMWPTYYGMTGEAQGTEPDRRGTVSALARSLLKASDRKEMIAPSSGQVDIPFVARSGRIAYTLGEDRSWFIFPTPVREYTFYVDGAPATLRVPADFGDFDRLAIRTFYPQVPDEQVTTFAAGLERQARAADGEHRYQRLQQSGGELREVQLVRVPRTVRRGEVILGFDLAGGDQVLVDRFSLNFVRPVVGHSFVFRTDHIPGTGAPSFYIKRLMGEGGDVVEIRPPGVLRNGSPLLNATALVANTQRTSPYRGYFNASRDDSRYSYFFPGEKVVVPPRRFLALGDNSAASYDSRFWGFVPEKDVVGRPLFIYYPFTSRWGIAR